MKWSARVSMREALLSLFFPRICPMCGVYVGEEREEGMLCFRCIKTLPRTEQAYIPHNITEMTLWGDYPTPAEAKRHWHLARGAAFLFYAKGEPIQGLVHKMKYAEQPMIGYYLGALATDEFLLSEFYDPIDVIIPVPLHPHRLRTRGYNQSEYIARGIRAMTGLPVDTTHLMRVKDTPKQAKIKTDTKHQRTKSDLRRANVKEAFAVQQAEELQGKHILLVDDLITTGETIRACLQALRTVRGARVSVFALCKAV